MKESELVALAKVAGWVIDVCELPQSSAGGRPLKRLWSAVMYRDGVWERSRTLFASSKPEVLEMVLREITDDGG